MTKEEVLYAEKIVSHALTLVAEIERLGHALCILRDRGYIIISEDKFPGIYIHCEKTVENILEVIEEHKRNLEEELENLKLNVGENK